MMKPKVCVLGAGIIGLSCATRLKEVFGASLSVTVVADKFGGGTTSDLAAGGFRPGDPVQVSGYNGNRTFVAKDMVMLSFERYKSIVNSKDAESAGIHNIRGYDIRYPGVGNDKPLFYTKCLDSWRPLSDAEIKEKFPLLPPGSNGNYFETVVVSPATYMPWITQRFKSMGGELLRRHVASFDELWSDYDLVLNCTGLNSRSLTGDTSLIPIRGQLIRMNLTEGKNTFVYINDGTERMPCYYWTPDHTIVGVTKCKGNDNTNISQEEHDWIMDTSKAMFPWLDISEDKIVKEIVGFRPYRPLIRLEAEAVDCHGKRKWIVHNYGHGAHGITLSWGSACIAAELVSDILQRSKL